MKAADLARKDFWDKAGVVLSPVGGLFTALAVAAVGFFATRHLNTEQEAETKQRIYAELMTKREEADVSLRKDMFNSIIGTFLRGGNERHSGEDLLKLELLAYNFHDSLDLGPLFKHVYQGLALPTPAPAESKAHVTRLKRMANVITGKQIDSLREPGSIRGHPIDLSELKEHPEGITVFDGKLSLGGPRSSVSVEATDRRPRRFVLDLLKVDGAAREINIRLRVSRLGSDDVNADPEVDKSFWVGFFDFPMIENTRLSHHQRCAVVLNEFELEPDIKFAETTLLYFPGERASLKEKPYYQDVLHNLRRVRDTLAEEVE